MRASFPAAALLAVLLLASVGQAATYMLDQRIVGVRIGTDRQDYNVYGSVVVYNGGVRLSQVNGSDVFLVGRYWTLPQAGIVFAKLAGSNLVWLKRVTSSDALFEVSAIHVSSSGIYIATLEGYLLKFDPAGNLLWAKKYNLQFLSIAEYNGSLYLVGVNGTQGFVMRTDLGGNVVWALLTPIGGRIVTIDVDATGVYVSGTLGTWFLMARLTHDGSLVWAKTLRDANAQYGYPGDIHLGSNWIYVATSMMSTAGDFYTIIAAMDRNGTLVWQKTLDRPGLPDKAQEIILWNGTLYAVIYDEALYPKLVAKIDEATQQLVWVGSLAHIGIQGIRNIAASQGQLYITGSIPAPNNVLDLYVIWSDPDLPFREDVTSQYLWADGSSTLLASTLTLTNITAQVAWTDNTGLVSVFDYLPLYTVLVNNAPIYASFKRVKTSQSLPDKPELHLAVTINGTTVNVTIDAQGTGPVSGEYGYAFRVRDRLVVYSPVLIENYHLEREALTLQLSGKALLSIATMKEGVKRIVVDGVDLCTTPSDCEALRDLDNVIAVDPSTVTIYFSAPLPLGASLGGRAEPFNPAYPATLVAVAVILAVLAWIIRR